MLFSARPLVASALAAILLLTPSAFAFDTPLSDEAVREAYFLGQRHDETMARLLNRYTRLLPPPQTGPHIYSVTFFTPFALLVQQSSQSVGSSAQQAEKSHRGTDEIVAIAIEILLTPSYPALISKPTSSRSGSPVGYELRSPGFWRDFNVQVFNEEKSLIPATLTGEPRYLCSYEGGCSLTGAVVRLEFPARLFTSDSATIQVDPPEGDSISVDFDLASIR